MITITRELSINPRRGNIPFDANLRFSGQAISEDVTMDVIYCIDKSSAGDVDVAFETDEGPSDVIRRDGVVFTAIPRGVSKRVRFVRAGSGASVALATIRAYLVEPGADVTDKKNHFDMTANAVRILRG